MGYIEISKVGVDILLMLSIIYLAWRLAKPSTSFDDGRVRQLEESLRSLIREAEESSRSLGDHLMRRQQGMEKLLHEFESAEGRIQRTVKGADTKISELENEIHKAALVLRSSSQSAPPRRVEPPETSSFTESHYVRTPAMAPQPEGVTARRPLSQEIEREVYDNAYEVPLEQVVAKAEQVASISQSMPSRTRPVLSKLEDTKDRLHSMRSAVERWEASAGRSAVDTQNTMSEETADDSRLGVLGSARRQATTV